MSLLSHLFVTVNIVQTIQSKHCAQQNTWKYKLENDKYSQEREIERDRERERETQPWRHITLEEQDARVSVKMLHKTAREKM